MPYSSSKQILRNLSRENAFYFFTSAGNYTGHIAFSLEEFTKKIKEIKIESLEFHLYRGDFEKWIDEVLNDKILTEKIKTLKLIEPIGDSLRDRLYSIVSKRLEELKNME